jgi:uracil-DNA glycosylase
MSTIKLHQSWEAQIGPEFLKPYMVTLENYLQERVRAGAVIYPKGADFFTALDTTLFQDVKVVILGQDPYHGLGQAHGLCFSVPNGVKTPPSLMNIFKELEADIGMKRPTTGCLESWAKLGVLLLNSVLTVEINRPASHQGKGWELFTDSIIRAVAATHRHCVFMLWGAYAQRKGAFIDRSQHLVIESAHPSPLSAHRGFLGSRPFSRANTYLKQHGHRPIQWDLN